MEQSSWARPQTTRRGFLRGIGRAAGALTLAPALAACSSGSAKKDSSGTGGSAPKPVKGGTLTSSLPSDVSNLDYAAVNDFYSNAVIANCVEPLLTADTQGQPTGLLATSWENPDGQTYIFRLRQGVTFQDGTDFNADAVEYSLNRIRTNKAATPYPQLVYIEKLEKPDQGTIKMTLNSPFAPFLGSLAFNAGRVISPAIAEKYGKDKLRLDLTGQGTGPFRFGEWKADDHITLTRNETYWGKDAAGMPLPYVDKLIFRVIPDANTALVALRNGELDVLSLGLGFGPPAKDTANVKADPSLTYKDRPSNGYTYLFFNEAKEPFGSRELRQAIAYAIDRTALTHNVFFDTVLPLDVVFSPSSWAYDADYHPYLKRDMGKAKQLLAQAGKPNGFAFTLLISYLPSVQQTAELVKDQLKEAGIEMTIQQVESPKLLAAVKAGEHQAAHFGALAGLDPDSWVYPYFSTKGAQNANTHYRNPEVDRLLDQARTTLDVAQRKPLYQQAQKLFMGDAPFCVHSAIASVALSSRKVQNVPLGPSPAVGASQVWKTG